ncbi:MAG: DUF4430 domain-containing protein [Ruminococcaceae bacterium]|nr:DUF4430 domain-containing protein [Oscillospiraceae bacterium]
MNKIRILALLLVLVLVFPVLSACGSNKLTSTVSITFRVPNNMMNGNIPADDTTEADTTAADTTVADGTTGADSTAADTTTATEDEYSEYTVLFNLDSFVAEGTQTNPPTVLSAVQAAFSKYEITYDLSKDGTYISSVTLKDVTYAESEEVGAEITYFNFWECTINGKLSSSGRQSETVVYEGDKIVFTWTRDNENRRDTTAVQTVDPNADTTGEIFSNDTTIADDSAEEVA